MNMRAKHLAINFNEVHKLLRWRMRDSQDTMSKYANQERIDPPLFRVGDRVCVCADHIRTNRTFHQLTERKIADFLLFPSHPLPFASQLFIRIHPVSHVSQLGPEDPNTFEGSEQPPPPLVVD